MNRTRMLLATLAIMLGLLTLGACGAGDDDDDSDGGFSVSERDGAALGSGGDADAAPEAEEGAAGGGAAYQAGPLRKIIFTSSLDLAAEDVRASFDRAALVARQVGGYVERSSLTNREGDAGEVLTYASITLRVPVAEYDAALNDLRTMPGITVVSEESDSTEVTEEYTDLESRLRNLERTETTYLALLEQAETIEDILTVNDRLGTVRGQIEQIQGRLNVLDDLTELATVSVSLVPAEAGVAVADAGDDGPPGFLETLESSLEWSGEALRYLAAAAGVALVGAAWLGVALAVLFAGSRILRRRGQAA